MKAKKNIKSKQTKYRIKKDDLVMVIGGDEKGKEGKVLSIDKEKDRVFIEGLNMVKKHVKPTASNPNGDIIEIESSIHISNVMLIDPATKKPRRTGRIINENGKSERFFKKHTSLKEEK